MRKGTKILEFNRLPYIPYMPVVILRLASLSYRGAFAIVAYEASGVPFKPACLYGME